MSNKRAYVIIWICTLLFSIAFLWFGHIKVSEGLSLFDSGEVISTEAKVVEVLDYKETDSIGLGGDINQKSTLISFICTITKGNQKGETVEAIQTIEPAYQNHLKPVTAGDHILLYGFENGNEISWNFHNYIRSNSILWLLIIFILLVLWIGKGKGINTIVSLGVTCLAVFFVFIPSVLNGYNVYLSSFIICSFTIVTTLLFVNGICRKTIATILGCLMGITVDTISTLGMSHLLNLTGMVDEESYYLTMIRGQSPINVKSIIFGCILIGALGAIMDIAMDISSSMHEIKRHNPSLTFHELLDSGMAIGRDVIGTMSNTLVLAYIGSSLSSILLLLTYSTSLFDMINHEMVIVDLLQALIGSIAILLTIPFTAFIGALLYSRQYIGEHTEIEENHEFDAFWK